MSIKMQSVILLGAGASRGTLGEIAPLSADFGQCLNAIMPNWRSNYPYLSAALRFLRDRIPDTTEQSWALDRVWSAIDNRVKLRFILGLELPEAPFPPPKTKRIYARSLDPWGLAGFDLRCVMSSVYGNRLTSKIQDAIQGNGTLKQVSQRLEPEDCVVSLNYDLLAEKMLNKIGKAWSTANQWSISSSTGGKILLCKPHGSLSWKQWVPEFGRAIEILDGPMAENEIDFDPAQDATLQPAVVGPVPFKSEIIMPEVQGNVLNSFELLAAQWKAAIERISQAEKLIILGYSFPSEDLHAQYLFAEASVRRQSSKKLEIEVYQRTKQSFDRTYEKLVGLFKTNSIKYMGSVEP